MNKYRPAQTRRRSLVVLFLLATTFMIGSARAEESTLPNLVALPPYDFIVALADDSTVFEGLLAIRFSVGVANRGLYGFDLQGTAAVPNVPAPGERLQLEGDAGQCVTWLQEAYDTAAVCSARSNVGRIYYHDEHSHWHLDRFVSYELRRLDAEGAPVWGPEGLVGESKKVSFCLQDSEEDTGPPEGSPAYRATLYEGCSTLATMGISPGYKDVYDNTLYDQQIPLAGIPDGAYALAVVANPDGRFLETTGTDNVAFQRIVIEGETVTTV